jgi:hypothetical protein
MRAAYLIAICCIGVLVSSTGTPKHDSHPTARIPVARRTPSIESRVNHKANATVPLPEVRYKVYVHSELTRQPKALRSDEHLHCHHKAEKPWNVTRHVNGIRFFWNAEGSDLAAEHLRRVLQEAADTWSEEAPTLPDIVLEKSDSLILPSTLASGIRNGRNEIAFGEPRTTLPQSEVLAEAFVWHNHTSNEILEVDLLFRAPSAKVSWFTDHGQHSSDAFDLHSVATACIGHAIGLGISDEHYHSTFGLSGRGETHKRTLECGDKQAARKLYS